MNHSKIILVACISAFVAITTFALGITGSIIGSVVSSVLYNVLSEALEKPVSGVKFPKANLEWDIAYVFPLVVISVIQLIWIFAFLSNWGILPHFFMNIYLSIQGVADFNLYRILGLSLIVMSVYPFILKGNHVKRSDGLVVLIVGLMFLARGFSDVGSAVSHTFGVVYDFVSFPISLIAFILLIHVIYSVLSSARSNDNNPAPKNIGSSKRNLDDLELKEVYHRDNIPRNQYSNQRSPYREDTRRNQYSNQRSHYREDTRRNQYSNQGAPSRNNYNPSRKNINNSSNDFQFESNDLLDDFKK